MVKQPEVVISEQTLLDGLRRNNPDSQAILVRHYGPRVLATAKRYLRNPDDAADVFQDAFIKVFGGIGSFEGRSTLWYWMRCITVRVALTHLRKQKNRAETSFEAWHQHEDSNVCLSDIASRATESIVESNEIDQHLRTAVDMLPDQYRAIIVIRDFLGASTQEAADKLGIKASVARVRLHRARSALRKLLNERFSRSDLVQWHPDINGATDDGAAVAAAA